MAPWFESDARFAALETELLRWKGTPFVPNQGRPGAGTDCVRFVEGVLRNLGAIRPVDFPPYVARGGGAASLGVMLTVLDGILNLERTWTWAENLGRPALMRGDLVVVKVGPASYHLAICAALPVLWHCFRRVCAGNVHDTALEGNVQAVYRVMEP
jgi:cell wall-associated NlpC family hydrolase